MFASSFDKFKYLGSKCIKQAINHRFHIRENIDKPLGTKFLDFGCGVGGTSILASNDGFEVYSFDIDKKSIFFSKEIKDRYEIRFLLANGEKHPFKDKVFDVVYSCHVLEHVSNDFNALNEIYRVLKDDGIFILSVPNIYNLSSQFKKKLGYKKPFVAPTHLREYDESELRNKLKDSGFHVILSKRSGFLLPFGNVIFNFFIVQFNLGKVKEYFKTKIPLCSESIDIMATKKNNVSLKVKERALPIPWWLR
jgi:ubiquinone/menaquinone biosynthesis C-methylase UbiE